MATLSLFTVVIVVILGSVTSINLGWYAIFAASVLGFLAHESMSTVTKDFPVDLFLTLVSISLLFTHARLNGTLDRVAAKVIAAFGTESKWIPLAIFLLSLVISAIGAGNIAGVGLIAPMAMHLANDLKMSPLLMALMICNGANAGALSPLAPTGVIASHRMSQIGLHGLEWQTFLNTLIVHTIIALIAFFIFQRKKSPVTDGNRVGREIQFEWTHRLTLFIVLSCFFLVILFHLPVWVGAFAGSILISLFRLSKDEKSLGAMSYRPIWMVVGMVTLTTALDRHGGLDLFTEKLAHLSNATWVVFLLGFSAGLVSVYSSSSAVVLPTFLGMIPKLHEHFQTVNSITLASTVVVSSHLVDVSPLSTIGAICISVIPDEHRKKLFREMLLWGLSMAVVGALLCALVMPLLN